MGNYSYICGNLIVYFLFDVVSTPLETGLWISKGIRVVSLSNACMLGVAAFMYPMYVNDG